MANSRQSRRRGFRARAAGLSVALALGLVVGGGAVGAGQIAGRPDLESAKPQAACGLQSLGNERAQPMRDGVVLNSVYSPVPEDPLANYARTTLGDWQMPANVDRSDPWLRFVLFAVKRPIVVDIAVFVDGKPYADGREAWIDGVLEESSQAKQAAPVKTAIEPAASPDAVAAAADVAAETDKKKEIVPQASDQPKVSAQARSAPGMRERLLDYLATPGPQVDRREIRWLVAEWGVGPPVVVLDSSLSWQRARMAPLVAYLDQDQSGALDAAEIAAAFERLQQADADRNDVVDEQELRRKADRPAVLPFATDHPLVVPIDEATDEKALAADLARVYGSNETDVAALEHGPADATLRVDFGKGGAQRNGVAVLAVGPELEGAPDAVSATANVITLDLGAEYVEFSAAAPAAMVAGAAGTQIGIGAAIDGNPLLRLLDTDQDHRLTRRERQQLPALLASLDRDHDGTVAAAELPIPIRFAVTLGPVVHTLLAQPTGAARQVAPESAPAAPDWFVSMDKNGDHDLSRSEFLGTAEQFGQLDADSDGLVSVREASEMETGH